MRKSLAILLLILYIVASSGVAIRAHYCCGKLKSVSLVLDSSSDKVCSGEKKISKNCCKDDIATNAPLSDQKATSLGVLGNSFKEALTCMTIISHGFFLAYFDDAEATPICTSPPTAERHIHIAIRVLRV
jgi:hypothetical protein